MWDEFVSVKNRRIPILFLWAVVAAEGGRCFLTIGKMRRSEPLGSLYQHFTMHLFKEKEEEKKDCLPWRGHVRETCA